MLTLRKYDLFNDCWSSATEIQPVQYRNTLLERMYPELDIAIGDVSGFIKEEKYDAAKSALDASFENYQIVGASGSRKKGCALFVRGKDTTVGLNAGTRSRIAYLDCFSRFFGSPANCINYGSNLVTECKSTYELTATILVVKDGEYGTGDCHGKCSKDFALGVVGQLQRPFQFRAAVKAKKSWVAKGTIAFSFDTGGYDLVLPESCFKGNKVKPGVYSPKLLYFGVVGSAEVRHVKMSYSVTQYLPWSAVEADILPGTIAQARSLAYLQSNIRELTEFLSVHPGIDCDECDGEDGDRYISPLAQIVAADIHGQLLEHPWVVRHIKEMVRKRWLRLATAGAVQFHSCMSMPDDSLPDNTVCIPHLPEGEVIVFPYPCRWKHDIKIWQNTHNSTWKHYEGVIAGSHSTMLQLGRDYDGDYVQCLPASMLPNVAIAIKEFGDAPELSKPAKEKISGSLGEIAVRSMDNCVGLITYAIAKAWATNNHHLIKRLAQELQVEVDSLKNVQRAERWYIEDVLKSMGDDKVDWLSDHKEDAVFMTRTICTNGNDTISRLASAVNAVWTEFVPIERNLVEFRNLFPFNFPLSWKERATLRRNEYRQKIGGAIKLDDPKQISHVVREIKQMGESIPENHKFKAAAAFWHVCHAAKSGTASLVFHAFTDQIIEQLSTQQFSTLTIVGTNYGDFAPPKTKGKIEALVPLHAEHEDKVFPITIVAAPDYPERLAVRIGDRHLGLLAADSAKWQIGTTVNARLSSRGACVVARTIVTD